MKTKKWILPVCIAAAVIALCIIVPLSIAGAARADETDLSKHTDGGAGKTDETTEPQTAGHEEIDGSGAPDVTSVAFRAQYIRTNGYHEDTRYPVVKLIRSVQELKAYYEANKEEYDLERKDTVYADTTVGFLDACDAYDASYFEEHLLVMVLLEEGSGSIRHNVRSVTIDSNGSCCIYIDTVMPECGTADMAEWHILIEPEAGAEIKKESDIIVYVDGVDPLTQPVLVRHDRGFANISLNIFAGWEYEIDEPEGTNEFCIAFWPAGMPEGKLKVWYLNGFGVCGTGLQEEEIALGGYEAYKGTYDGGEVWDFICLIGTPGSYVVLNEGAGRWWGAYGDEAMRILNTMAISDGIIGEDAATAIAEQEATVEYDQIWTSYDSENGLWTVMLAMEGRAGGEQTVTITCEGKVIDIQYGE